MRITTDNQTELGLTSSQSLALFGKIVRRLTKHLQDIHRLSLGQDIPLQQPSVSTLIKGAEAEGGFKATVQTIEEDLADNLAVENAAPARENRLEGVDLAECVPSIQVSKQELTTIIRFAIEGNPDFSGAEAQIKALANATPAEKARLSTTISVKNKNPIETVTKQDKKGGKEKRRESGGGDAKKHKKPKVKA